HLAGEPLELRSVTDANLFSESHKLDGIKIMLNRITVQLPVEGLLFWKLTGREAMSESFALTLTVLGTDARIDRSKLLGQPVTVTIPTQNLLTSRYVNGKITRVAVSAVELTGTRYAVYQLTVEPDLWPMKR